jgi:hypothetical protein
MFSCGDANKNINVVEINFLRVTQKNTKFGVWTVINKTFHNLKTVSASRSNILSPFQHHKLKHIKLLGVSTSTVNSSMKAIN